MKLVLVPNNMKSKGAKALAQSLSDKVGYKVFRVRRGQIRRRKAFVLSSGTDKLTQLNAFNSLHLPCPEFTEDMRIAHMWIEAGSVVVCRTLLRASEGRGIIIAERVDQLVPAPLYTKYIPKKAEYRVHVLNGRVIDVQMKKKRNRGNEERNTRIRNLANGYVFCREGIQKPEGLEALALAACSALNYNMGAVDIVYNAKRAMLYVLEVNANPGMQGQTLENYANAIVGDLT